MHRIFQRRAAHEAPHAEDEDAKCTQSFGGTVLLSVVVDATCTQQPRALKVIMAAKLLLDGCEPPTKL